MPLLGRASMIFKRPTCPVVDGCVPPQATYSKSPMATTRICSRTVGGLRSGIFARVCASGKEQTTGHIALDIFVDRVLQGAQLLRRNMRAAIGKVGVDAGRLGAQVQADDVPAQLPPDGVGKHVLAAVLLHMVKAARPVDLTANFAARPAAARSPDGRTSPSSTKTSTTLAPPSVPVS